MESGAIDPVSTGTQPGPLFARADRRLPWRFLAGVTVTLIAALGVFYLLLRPGRGDVLVLASLFAATAALAALAGFGAYRQGWIVRSPGILWILLGGYVLANLLTFFTIGVTAWLMFTSYHHLLLATVLLLFASGIAISLGYFLSAALRDGLLMLVKAAEQIAAGDLRVRVSVSGNNKLSNLARSFNSMAEQLQRAAAERAQTERLRRDLIAWVGHDLRTPLASIRAIVEALADGVVEDPETTQRYLRTAQADIRALSLSIDDLFAMAQLDAGGLPLNRAPISIADLISDTIEQFSAVAAAQGIDLQGSVEPGVDVVTVDAGKISRVLANLVDNALHYTGRGGAVHLQATRAPGRARAGQRHRFRHPPRRLAVRVRAVLPGRGVAQPGDRRRGAGAGDHARDRGGARRANRRGK